MTAPHELTITIGRRQLRGLTWGEDSAPPILALHGWLDNAASFAELAPLLKAWRLIALDLPGHGLSSHKETYHFIDWVEDVEGILDGLGLSSCRILGHSMGAAIALLTAATLPERVHSLCLLEGVAPLTAEPAATPERLRRFLAKKKRSHPDRRHLYASRAEAFAARAAAGSFRHEKSLLPMVERGLVDVPGGFTWRSDPLLKLPSAIRLTLDQVRAFVEKVVCPIHIVRASAGFPFPEELWKELLALPPDVTTSTLEGGHHLHLDAPEAVARDVQRFFTRVP